MHDEDEFDLRRYFLDIDDPEERARTIHESGWEGHPDIEDIERDVARVGGGTYQGLLAALQTVKDEDDLQPVEDEDESDLRRYFLDIDDPEERARTIHESGWGAIPISRTSSATWRGLEAARIRGCWLHYNGLRSRNHRT